MAVLKYLDDKDRKEIYKLCSAICDEYCRFPHMSYDDEYDINTICETCPLNEIEQITGVTE